MIKKIVLLLFLSFFLDAGLFDFYYIHQFKQAYQNKEYKKALKALNHLNDLPEINFNKANVYYKMGDYYHAIKFYKRAYGKGVKEYQRLFNLGNAYFKAKKIKKAIIAYKASLRIKKTPNALNNLKLAFLFQENRQNYKNKTKHKKNTHEKDKKPQEDIKNKKELKKADKKMLQEALKKALKGTLTFKKIPVILYKIESGPKMNLQNW